MRPENLTGLDYHAESESFQKLPFPIIDIHSHINGNRAVELYRTAAREYGVELTYSMTQLEGVAEVRAVLGDSVKFIAIPNWSSNEPIAAHTTGYAERLKGFWNEGSRIAKYWSAPRIFDYGEFSHHQHPLRLNSPQRLAAIQQAVDMGYKLMFHVADPDTWFATKYKNSARYGTKAWHYEIFEEILARFAPCPILAAHMAGSPEDLARLSRLLSSYPHLSLDCSATKWQVRELSKHEPAVLREFFARWRGRILFGSDIVTAEAHLSAETKSHEMLAKAADAQQAYDLYASRYWAFRKLLETDFKGASPIADPDLHMLEPQRFTEFSSPELRGASLPEQDLRTLYHDAAVRFIAG